MSSKVLVTIKGEDGRVIQINEGETVLGRGELTGVTDKKCSRKQLTLTLSNNKLYITPHGMNSCHLLVLGEYTPLLKEQKSKLADSDIFTLFLRNSPFKVSITPIQSSSDSSYSPSPSISINDQFPSHQSISVSGQSPPSRQSSTTTSSISRSSDWTSLLTPSPNSTTPNLSKKQNVSAKSTIENISKKNENEKQRIKEEKYDSDEGEGDFWTADISPKKKVQKQNTELYRPPSSSNTTNTSSDLSSKKSSNSNVSTQPTSSNSNRPICQYGEKCYRTQNPNHCREFRHPHLENKPNQNDNDNDDEQQQQQQQQKQTSQNKKRGRKEIEDLSDEQPPQKTSRSPPTSSIQIKKENGTSYSDDNNNNNSFQKPKTNKTTTTTTTTSTSSTTKKSNSRNQFAQKDIYRLAFPSLATDSFKFDINKAAFVIINVVKEFLSEKSKYANIRLCFVSDNQKIIQLVRNGKINDTRFEIIEGDILKLNSQYDHPADVICNETNWRFKPTGSGLNNRIHQASPTLSSKTKEKYLTAKVGNAYEVELDEDCPFRMNEKVSYVIHCLAPNMNEDRPNCLNGDYETGIKLLKQTYQNLFECFFRLLKET